MRPILSLILLISFIVKFCEPYNIRVEDPDSYKYEKRQDDQGNYEYEYSVFDANSQSKNRIYHQETRTLKQSNLAQDDSTIIVNGHYYYRNNGFIYKVTYEADENGFRPRLEIISEKYFSKNEPPSVKPPPPGYIFQKEHPPVRPPDRVEPFLQTPGVVRPDPITSDALKTLQGG